FIEMKDALEIGLDGGIEAVLLIERPSGRDADQKKRDRDNREERRNCGQEPPEDVAKHWGPSAQRHTDPAGSGGGGCPLLRSVLAEEPRRMHVHDVVLEALELRRDEV